MRWLDGITDSMDMSLGDDLCLPDHITSSSECLKSPSALVRTFVIGFQAHRVDQDDHEGLRLFPPCDPGDTPAPFPPV